MSTDLTSSMIQVTFRYPGGSVRLAAPSDVPLGELMPDLLDLAEQPDGDGWVLGADGVARVRERAHTRRARCPRRRRARPSSVP